MKHSIFARVMLAGIVLALAGVVLRYGVLTKFLREDLELVVSAQQATLAGYIASDVDYKVRERQSLLDRLARALPPELIDRPERLGAWLGERHELMPLFSVGLMVLDLDGVAVADYPHLPGRVGASFADHEDFQRARTGQALVGKPLMGPLAKQPLLPMASPIRDANGAVRGVLVGTTALAAPGFLDTLQKTRIGETGSFLLISPRHQLFVSASDPSMVLQSTPAPGVNPLHDRAMAGYRGAGVTINSKGVEEVSAIATVPSADWFVVARLPTAEAFATVARTQAYVLRHGVTVLVVVVVMVSLVLWIALKPLYEAARLADRMTREETPLAPLPVARDDEVGHLTRAFNRLLSKLTSSQDELARMAHHDSLTGLPNRHLLADRMQQAIARAHRSGARVAVLFMDLDGFKSINDTLGHEAGDEVLRLVARHLAEALRQNDTLARVGGDEFVLLASDLDGSEEEATAAVQTIARKCIASVAVPLSIQGRECHLGVSIGIALRAGDTTLDQLLIAADRAMYQAKEGGRGRYAMAPIIQGANA